MSKCRVLITKGSNFFKINEFDEGIKKIAYEFTRRFIRIDYQSNNGHAKDEKTPMTVFAAALKDRSEFRFHINSFDEWLKLLEGFGVKPEQYKIIQLPHVKAEKIKFKLKKGWKPFDYQIPIIEYLVTPNNPPTDNKLVSMQTGRGKGFCAISALSQLAERTIFIIRPGYIKKWVDEFIEKTNVQPQEMMAVRGGAELKAFLQLCSMGELGDIKFVFISNKTYQIWLKAYEEFGKACLDLGYAFVPEELFEKAKAGIRTIDEVHQDFHLCFKQDLYTNANLCISMSATLKSYVPATEKMYRLAYPIRSRAPEVEIQKYVDTFAVSYYMQDDRNFQTTEWNRTTYSHNALEKSILRNKEFTRSYTDMISKLVKKGYHERHKDGDTALIFASSIAMCDKLTQVIARDYPQYKVKRFCENDPLSNLLESDICISNVIKAGTAFDIKGLTCVILTIALDSLQSNLQIFGRLRDLKDRDTQFYFLTCQSIEKHKKYHMKKIELLKPRSKSYHEILYPTKV